MPLLIAIALEAVAVALVITREPQIPPIMVSTSIILEAAPVAVVLSAILGVLFDGLGTMLEHVRLEIFAEFGLNVATTAGVYVLALYLVQFRSENGLIIASQSSLSFPHYSNC